MAAQKSRQTSLPSTDSLASILPPDEEMNLDQPRRRNEPTIEGDHPLDDDMDSREDDEADSNGEGSEEGRDRDMEVDMHTPQSDVPSPNSDMHSPRSESRDTPAPDRTTPTRNAQGRIVCQHPSRLPACDAMTFERPCEWRKHMDKHTRPHRCTEPSCAELKGFTYPGGLLRHLREVHGMAGGPKEVLHCPVAYCKRHSGPGFSRRENLNEHMKRLHRNLAAKREGSIAQVSAGHVSERQASAGSAVIQPSVSQRRDSLGEPSLGEYSNREKAPLLDYKPRRNPTITFTAANRPRTSSSPPPRVEASPAPTAAPTPASPDAALRKEVETLKEKNAKYENRIRSLNTRVTALKQAISLIAGSENVPLPGGVLDMDMTDG